MVTNNPCASNNEGMKKRRCPEGYLRLGGLGFVPFASVHLLDFFAQSPLLFLFGLQLQGPLVHPAGLLLLVRLEIAITQVFGDNGIIGHETMGLFQPLDCPGIFLFLIVYPAETIRDIPVVGLELQRLLDEGLGLVQLYPLFRVGISQVVEGIGVFGIEL
jgi:hypothetical protein